MPDETKFVHDVDGQQIVLPAFDQIPVGVIRKLRKEDAAEQMFGLLEQLADKKTLAIIDKLTARQVNDMFEAWQKTSATTAGESTASADS
jgi:hypothetical protein